MIRDDSALWRPQPLTPYRPSGCTTRASSLVLATTLRALLSAGRTEAGCLWLGKFEDSGDALVEAVIVPKQTNRARNYSIAAGAMQQVAIVARPRKWTLVATVHSHPGNSVEHSEYDDQMVPSRSALSLVFANYGVSQGKWPDGIGVHEFIDNYWHLLPEADAAKRVIFTDGLPSQLFDLR